MTNEDVTQAAAILKKGGLVVLPTDTIFGIVAKASCQRAVENLYKVKQRRRQKPFIILVSSLEQINSTLTQNELQDITLFNEGANSIILPVEKTTEPWLLGGGKTAAYRLIKPGSGLWELITKTGPLVAPSANPEGLKPASSILEAKEYFGKEAALYIDGPLPAAKPSSIYQWTKDGFIAIR